jgi:hypothetical protein
MILVYVRGGANPRDTVILKGLEKFMNFDKFIGTQKLRPSGL